MAVSSIPQVHSPADGHLVEFHHSVAPSKNACPHRATVRRMNRLTFQAANLTAVLRRSVFRSSKCRTGTRILMFHDINMSQSHDDVYSLPSNTFSEFVKRLRIYADGHDIDLKRFGDDPAPGVAVTFDDGYASTLTYAAEQLTAQSIPFHVFLTKQYVESLDARYLNSSDVVALSRMPMVSLGVHGVSHSRMSTLPAEQIRRELNDSKHWLEDLIGRSVDTASYPHGDFDDSVVQIAKEVGLISVACSKSGTYVSEEQRLSIPRIDVWALDSAATIMAKLHGSWDHVLP